MNNGLSLSIFTMEADRNPVVAIQGRKQSEAEAVLFDEILRDQLRLLRSAGRPLCDDFSIFRLRIARPDERALYFENANSLLTGDGRLAVLLVQVDQVGG